MFKSEKQSENNLSNCLKYLNFDESNLYFSPKHNSDLKKIFTSCSKRGSGCGIPDRIYYNKKIMIIFECKKDDLAKAKCDILHYFKSIDIDSMDLQIYGVAFVCESIYKIYKMNTTTKEYTSLKNKTLCLDTFGLTFRNNSIDMKSEIKKIHDYIYKYTKISNEDKSLFIAIILIGFKNKILIANIDSVIDKDNIYSLLESILNTYEINVNVFKPLSNNADKEHLYNLTMMIKTIYDKQPSIDLLNEFYSEFIKYGNTDSKSLGIVLTPPHIVAIMTKLMDINNNDIVLDLCTGTGSFLMEAHKYEPKMIIGCEYQLKLFNLLKCNMIIRNIPKYQIFNNDCFKQDFKATKSIINPPYSTIISEWEFIIKQLDSLEEGGECCAIVPNSIVNNSSTNTKFKQRILEQATIQNIILCRNSLFYPVANVSCIIIHIKKQTCIDNHITNIIDYRNDGFVSKRTQGWISIDPSNTEQLFDSLKDSARKINLTYDMNWYILELVDNDTVNISELRSLKLLNDFHNNILIEHEVKKTISISRFRNVSVKDYFEILSKPKIPYMANKYVYTIAAKNNNNGIKEISQSNINTFTGNKIIAVVGGDGGAGLCYYQSNDFNISSSTKVLSPLSTIILDDLVGLYICYQLSNNKTVYNRGNSWTNAKLLDTSFKLPFINDSIDYDKIHNFFE